MTDQMFRISAVHGQREWNGRNNSTFIDYTIELEGLDGRHTRGRGLVRRASSLAAIASTAAGSSL